MCLRFGFRGGFQYLHRNAVRHAAFQQSLVPLERHQGHFRFFIKNAVRFFFQVFQFLQPGLDPGDLFSLVAFLPDLVFFSHGRSRGGKHHQCRQNDRDDPLHCFRLLSVYRFSRPHSVGRTPIKKVPELFGNFLHSPFMRPKQL